MALGRTRSRLVSSRIERITEWWKDTSTFTQIGSCDTDMDYRFETIDDSYTPNFYELVKRGEIINNPCVMTVIGRRSKGLSSYRAHDIARNDDYESRGFGSITNYWLTKSGYTWSFPSQAIISVVDCQRDAKLQALARVDSTPYSFAEDLGEIGETLKFLRNPLESIHKLSFAFKNARVLKERYLRRLSRKKFRMERLSIGERTGIASTDPRVLAAADTFLAYRFALSPLVRSVCNLAEAYNKPVKRPTTRTSRGSGKDFSSKTGTTTSSTVGMSYTIDQQVETSAGIRYMVTNPCSDFQFKFGLRIKDIPVTYWNLMSLSFMVDRLVDVSSSIKAITNLADPDVKIQAAWVVTKLNSSIRRQAFLPAKAGWTRTIAADILEDYSFTYNREIWTPSLSDVVPRVKPMNVVKDAISIIDLLSIAIAKFS